MNYKDYFPALSEIENRLFEEGYWEIGFVDSWNKTNPMVVNTTKWIDMMNVVRSHTPSNEMYKVELLIKYMDGKLKFKKPPRKKWTKRDSGRKHGLVKHKMKDGSIKVYEYHADGSRETRIEKPNTEGNTQA